VFASLAAYEAGTPTKFTLQEGQSRFLTHFDQPGAFFQDQIQVTPRLTVTPGVRYDFQNALPGTMDAVLPRLSVAYVFDKKHGLVVRVGSGMYMRRVGVNIGQQLARYQYAAERSLLITSDLCYPITNCNSLAAQPPSLFNFEPNLKAPMQDYFSLSVERQVTKKSTLTIGYDGYRGWHALRSIDINAPLPPFTSAVRPNPNYAQILQQQSGGYQKSDSLGVSYRGRISNKFSGFMQYTYQHADANTEFSTFIPENQFNPNAEWSRTNFDQRHRFSFFGTLYPDKPLNLGVGFYANTATPYSITTGADNYQDGLTNARPAGVPRNSLNSGGYQDVQLRLGYTFKVRPARKDQSPTIGLSLSSFNTLNRVNYGGFVGVVTSADFMKPTTASDPRRLQLAASYNF
jgi:outer membrane receptor protein involved in Fe transport